MYTYCDKCDKNVKVNMEKNGFMCSECFVEFTDREILKRVILFTEILWDISMKTPAELPNKVEHNPNQKTTTQTTQEIQFAIGAELWEYGWRMQDNGRVFDAQHRQVTCLPSVAQCLGIYKKKMEDSFGW